MPELDDTMLAAQPSGDGLTPGASNPLRQELLLLAEFGKLDILKDRLATQEGRKAAWDGDPSPTSEHGNALMAAIAAGRIECAHALVPHCNPACVNDSGQTALICAAGRQFVGLVGALLPISNPNAQDRQGFTALNIAVAANRADAPDLVKLLLTASDARLAAHESGLDIKKPQTQPRMGRTPLISAAATNKPESLALLLPHSDPFAMDERNKSALAMALEWRNKECVRLLLPTMIGPAPELFWGGVLISAILGKNIDFLSKALPMAQAGVDLREISGALAHAFHFDEFACADIIASHLEAAGAGVFSPADLATLLSQPDRFPRFHSIREAAELRSSVFPAETAGALFAGDSEAAGAGPKRAPRSL